MDYDADMALRRIKIYNILCPARTIQRINTFRKSSGGSQRMRKSLTAICLFLLYHFWLRGEQSDEFGCLLSIVTVNGPPNTSLMASRLFLNISRLGLARSSLTRCAMCRVIPSLGGCLRTSWQSIPTPRGFSGDIIIRCDWVGCFPRSECDEAPELPPCFRPILPTPKLWSLLRSHHLLHPLSLMIFSLLINHF